MNTDTLKAMPVDLPPLAEQKAIAQILGTLDDKIELNRRMNATLEAMARALFQSWFVDFDSVRAKQTGKKPTGMDAATAALFPKEFQSTELGEIPKGWEVKRLAELCNLGRGASPRPINDYMNGEVPWIKIADATAADGPFLFGTKEKVKKAGAAMSIPVSPGDLILSNSATCGVPIFVEFHGCIHDGWLYFKNLHSISKLYLFHTLIELAEHLISIADGSVQKNLNIHLVGQQNVLVPPKPILDAFEKHAAGWFDRIRANSLESRTLATMRDALLPKLLSGELRVPLPRLQRKERRMAELKTLEKRQFEDLLGMSGGYVLDFTNRSFTDLFRDTVAVNIYDDKYATRGDSKANRLRTFWDCESNAVVGKVMKEILDVWRYQNPNKTDNHFDECQKIVSRLLGNAITVDPEQGFLHKDFGTISFAKLQLESALITILESRLVELHKALKADCPLLVVFMCGSSLREFCSE